MSLHMTTNGSPMARTRLAGERMRLDSYRDVATVATTQGWRAAHARIEQHLRDAAGHMSPRSLETLRCELENAASHNVAPLYDKIEAFAEQVLRDAKTPGSHSCERAHSLQQAVTKVMVAVKKRWRPGVSGVVAFDEMRKLYAAKGLLRVR